MTEIHGLGHSLDHEEHPSDAEGHRHLERMREHAGLRKGLGASATWQEIADAIKAEFPQTHSSEQ